MEIGKIGNKVEPVKIGFHGFPFSGKTTFLENIDKYSKTFQCCYSKVFRCLFEINFGLSAELGKGVISKSFRSEFKKNGIKLSSKTMVKTLSEGDRWSIHAPESKILAKWTENGVEKSEIVVEDCDYIIEKTTYSLYVLPFDEAGEEGYPIWEFHFESNISPNQIVVRSTSENFYRDAIKLILNNTQGILYFNTLRPYKLSTQREELIQFMDDYTQTIATPFHQFPVVFCYNKSDKLLQWLQEQEQRDGPIPQEDLAQVPTEPPIFLPQKQGEQIIDIPAPLPAHHHILSVWNRVLNPWNHPFFVTSALWGTNIETALLRLIELVIYRKDHGALDGNAYDGQPPIPIDEDE